MRFDLKNKRVYVAGRRGMAGSAIMRRLAREDCEIVTAATTPLREGLTAAYADFLATGGRMAA
jgi:NAD(P)-dependent dehydrogenase (short-subunit alcohol dehydrogenase family)